MCTDDCWEAIESLGGDLSIIDSGSIGFRGNAETNNNTTHDVILRLGMTFGIMDVISMSN